jgi:signal transduction histidine kinase
MSEATCLLAWEKVMIRTMEYLFLAIFFCWMPLHANQTESHLLKTYQTARGMAKVNAAIHLAESFSNTHPDSAFFYANQAYKLSVTTHRKKNIAIALQEMGSAKSAMGEYHEAAEYFQRAYTLLRALKQEAAAEQSLKALVHTYAALKDTSNCIHYAQVYLELAASLQDSLNQIEALHYLTDCSLGQKDYGAALSYLYDQLRMLPQDAGMQRWETEYRLAEFYYHICAYDEADKQLATVIRSSSLSGEVNFLSKCFALRSATALAQQKDEVAAQFANISLEYAQTPSEKRNALMLLAQASLSGAKLKSASNALTQLSELSESLPEPKIKAQIASLQGQLALQQQDITHAMNHYNVASKHYSQAKMRPEELEMQIAISELRFAHYPGSTKAHWLDALVTAALSTGKIDLIKRAYKLRYQFYKTISPKRALDDINEYRLWADSLYTLNSNTQLHNAEILHKTESQQQELQRLSYAAELNDIKLTQQATRRKIIMIIVAMVGVFSGYVLLRYRAKRRQDILITESNMQLTRKHAELQRITSQQEALVKELELLNATKTKFFSIISHDLKNAFHSLRTGCRLLSSDIGDLDNATITLLSHELKSSSEKVYKLLENLLQWAASQLGSLAVNPQEIVIQRIIDEVFDLLDPFAQKKGVSLENRVDDTVRICVDANMFRSVIENLVYNALKFCNMSDSITIGVTCDETCCRISVTDTGIGMDQETMEKLFRLDQHITTPGTGQEKGSGLGLILCSEFVHKNKGKIWLDSTLGQGTTVYIELPRHCNEEACDEY